MTTTTTCARRALPLALAAALALAGAACGDLTTIVAGVCGNGAVDPKNGEDCDLFADAELGPNTRCAPPGGANQCQYTCTRDGQGPACPLGWGCGVDGVCRRSSGRWAEAPGSPMPAIFGVTSLADVDGDDVPDLVSGDFDGVKVRFGERSGAYDEVTGVSLTLATQAAPAAADFDGDGTDDIAFADSSLDILLVASSDRARQLRPAPFPVLELTGLDDTVPGFVTYVPVSVDAQPFDRMLRVEVRADGHRLSFLEGGSPLEQSVSHSLSFVTLETPFRVVNGNIDADAADELVLAFDGENKARIFHAGVDGAQQPAITAGVEVTFPGPIFALATDLADVNADTRKDLVAVFQRVDGTLGVATALGNGAGGFAAPTVDARFDGPQPVFTSARPFLLCADVNGDRRADFLAGNGDLAFPYLYYVGDLHVASASALTRTDTSFFLDAVTGDFNRDGFADLALSTESGLDVRKGSATGFVTQHFIATGEFPSHLVAGDFDGDRADDIAYVEGVRNAGGEAPGAADVLHVSYGGTELPVPPPRAVAAWRSVAGIAPALLAGLSGDATRDLVVAYTDGADRRWLATLRGRGDRTFLAPRNHGLDRPLLVPGRFDGTRDGAPDLMLVSRFASDPLVLLRGGVAGFVLQPEAALAQTAGTIVPCANAARAHATLDLDDDGVDEAVVFYDCELDGTMAATLMQLGGPGDFVQGTATRPLTSGGEFPIRADVGDVDADGNPDVMLLHDSPPGYLLVWSEVLASGTGAPTAVALGPGANDVTVVNADDDPQLEVATLESAPGGGFLVTVTDVDGRVAGTPTAVLSLPDASGRLHVGDVNGDGLDDFIVPPRVFFAVPFDPRVDSEPDEPDDPDDPTPTECTGTCELVSQCGCGEGQACDLSGAENVCRDAPSEGTETTECEFNDDCAAGYSCISVFGLERAQCLRWCASDEDCTGPGGMCDLGISFGGSVVPGAITCTPNCDPITDEGCPEGFSCHAMLSANGLRHGSVCTPAGAGGQGDFCDDQGDCQPGHTCLGFTSTCSVNCAVSPASNNCPDGTTCQQYSDFPSFGGVEYGFCD